MLTSLTPANQQFVRDIDRLSEQMRTAQQQISTGKRIHTIADDPDQISTLLQARADLEGSRVTSANLGRVQSEVDAGEQAIQSGVKLFERVRTLGAAGTSDTSSAETRAALAQEVAAIYEELVGLTNTTVEGRFIFSGDQDQVSPYQLDLTKTPPLSAYGGSAATRQVQHPNGTTFPVSRTAQEIFDSTDPSTNVFKAVDALRIALQANDRTGIRTAVQNLDKPDIFLNRQLSFYGTTQQRIADAKEFGSRYQLQLQTQIGAIEDADTTYAILTLSQAKVNQQAAFEAHAQIPHGSLFDFLR